MPNFSIALTGLQADSTALNTIGNNLANLNTTAFKKQTTTFEDLFYQQIGNNGSGDTLQTGAGVRVSSTTSDFTGGAIAGTNKSTDMALDGDGFFVVQNGNVQSLTRAGNFQLDKAGNLQTTDGQSVMGFPAVNGAVTGTGSLTPLKLPLGTNESAKASSSFSLTGNLDASATIGTQYPATITMYDSLGQSHVASINFTKASTNNWNYAITLPPGDNTGTPVNNTGTLTFNSSGVLTSPSTAVSGITFPTMADGAADLTLKWNLFGTTGAPTLTQSASTSSANTTLQDGHASGTYQSFSVDQTGALSATFSNGDVIQVGQLAIASVANEGGLTRVGGNNYQTTAASGQISVGAAQTGSRGRVQDDALEASNVDISTEFSELIVAQRAFEANSKTVTTFDTVTQQAINMVR